MKTPSLYR